MRVVGVPMLKAERISCSGPKLSDAQTRNFEAIKHTHSEPRRKGKADPGCPYCSGRKVLAGYNDLAASIPS